MNRQFHLLQDIYHAAVKRVEPQALVAEHLSCKENVLTVTAGDFNTTLDLQKIERIFVIGAGKATAPMALAIENILGNSITDGVIVVKYGHTEALTKIRCLEADHPVPDQNGVRAVREILTIARTAGPDDLVFNLISGGGSALTPFPLEVVVSGRRIVLPLEEKQAVTRALLACGATIDEVNCVRKHLSLYKGGHLASTIYPARCLSLILSDVVGDRLDSIASGPTTFDSTTFEDVEKIILKYGLTDSSPPKLIELLELGLAGAIADTPKADDPAFDNVQNVLIGTNQMALAAAARKAEALGLSASVLPSPVIGEAREVAKVLYGMAEGSRRRDPSATRPLCLIAGGETTVTLNGDGKGGRNQEMALSFLSEMRYHHESTQGIYFLSAATDGNDGPTDAAGAFAANELLPILRTKGIDIDDHLRNNDSYSFFDALGYLFKPGPTNTNVCDLQLILVE